MGKVIYLKNTRRNGEIIMEKALSNVYDIAKAFLSLKEMDHLKLQKICYYAYALLLADSKGEKKLFNQRIEAWIHGPVIPDLHKQYASYGLYEIIPKRKMPTAIKRNEFLKGYVSIVNETYGKYNGKVLERISHQETPWLNARKGLGKYDYSNNKILDEDIIKYYNN